MYRAISRIFLHSHLDPLVIANDRIAYCADSHKHEVTPVINDIHNGNEHYPGDVLNDTAPPRLVSKEERSRLTEQQKFEHDAYRAYLKGHNVDTRDARAVSREVLRTMQKRKEMIGPGVDRGGCTLITPEMRETFVQNPGVRRIVPLND